MDFDPSTQQQWPDFYIIGAAKSGTTTLHENLKQHPGVLMPELKEPRYFAFRDSPPDPADPVLADSAWRKADYLALFSGAKGEQLVGEASPIYMAAERAGDTAAAIASARPDAKIIAILRDPAERAFSHFLMSQRQGFEPLSDFAAALAEPIVTIGDWTRERPYLPYSRYGTGLAPYFAHFPREAILVLTMDELRKDARDVLARLAAFLEIAPFPPGEASRANTGYAVRSPGLAGLAKRAGRLTQGFMPDTLRARLRAAYRRANQTQRRITDGEREAALVYLRSDIEALEELLGRKLVHWYGPRQ